MGASQTNLEVLIQIREDIAGLKKARSELQGAKVDAGKLGDALKQGLGIGTGMQMVTMAVGALKSAISATLGEALRLSSEINDSAQALGLSKAEYQALRIEFINAGAGIGRLQMAIDTQNRSLAEARDISSAAAKAYSDLGLSAAEIEQLRTAERMQEVARAIRNAKDQTVALSAATVIFGSRGLGELLNALRGVATEGIAARIEALRESGQIATNEAIDRADQLGKKFEKLGRQSVTAATEMQGSLNDMADAASAKPFETLFRLFGGPGMTRQNLQWARAQSLQSASKAQGEGDDTTEIDPEKIRQAQALAEQQEKEAKATEEAKKAADAHAEAIRKLGETTTASVLTPLERYNGVVESLKEQLAAGAISTATFERAIISAQAKLALDSQSFRLETEAIAAEATGNTKLAEQKREQIRALQLTAQLEGQQPALIQARIAAERQLTEAQRERTTKDLDYSQSVAQVDQEIARIEANNSLTERERQAKLLPLYERRNKLTADYIALLERDPRLQQGDQASIDLRKQINDLNKEIADTQGKSAQAAGPETLQMRGDKSLRDLGDPSQHYQSVDAGAAGAGKSFIAQIGTDGDIAASAISNGLNSALSDSVSWMQQLANSAITFQEFWSGAIGYVGQMFQRMAIEMVAKMLWRSTVERALVWLGVTTHVQGEATKTAATTTGVGMRVLLGIKEALVSVYKGALYAFEALANIPYVGPFLGAAAMAAAIAGGIALVGKMGAFEAGGIVHGGRQVIQVNENGTESVLNARATALLGADTIAALNAGNLASLTDLLSADVTGGIAAPVLAMQQAASISNGHGVAANEAPQVHVAFGAFNNQQHAKNWLESQAGEGFLINFLKRRGAKFDR